MSAPTTTASAPPRRRVKKRLLIPSILLALALAVFLWLYVRGTWADAVARNPKTTVEGAITQLFRTPEGNIQVRCAILMDASADRVWSVVTDYPDHPKFLPYVSEMTVLGKEGAKWHLSGRAHSTLWGEWVFQAHVTHQENPQKGEYVAFWDEQGPETLVNRGAWTLTAGGDNKTLVVYTLQLEVSKYPSFLVRNILLDRVHKVLEGLRDEMSRRSES